MSKFVSLLALVLLTGSVLYLKSSTVSADEKLTIEAIMEKGHKGKESPVQTLIAGKGDDKLIKQFVAYYDFMATQKPPVGDEAAWKKKVAAVQAALKDMEGHKAGAVDALKAAVNCKACHTDHKPKK